MPTVKIVTVFRDTSGHGFTETHYLAGGSQPNLSQIRDDWRTKVLQARRELLGNDTVIVGSRCSYPRLGAIASLPDKFFLGNTVNTDSASEAVSLAIQMVDSTNTRKKTIHLRGFWDLVEANGEYHPENGDTLGWQGKLDTYVNALVAGKYGWATRSTTLSAKGTVTNYIADANNIITFTLVPNPDSGALPTTQPIVIRFGRLSKGRLGVNRALVVKANSNTEVKTLAPIAAFPFSEQGSYNYRALDFAQYSARTVVSAGKRAQGRALNLFPGRQSKTARG